MNILIAVLSSIYFSIGYLGLLPVRMKSRYYLLLFTYSFSLYYWVDIFWGQWITIPLILGCSFIVYLGSHKNILHLTFALTGYLILILLNHIFTIPLSIIGKPISYLQKHSTITFLLIQILVLSIALRLLRRFFILPRLSLLSACPQKLLYFFLTELYVGLALMTANFIYGEAVDYPTEVLSLNGTLITAFTLSTILIFYNMYDILKKNHELSLQQAQSAIMQDYAHRMECLYEDVRAFRHDYRNILATMLNYIDEENTKALKEYFHKTILHHTPVLSDDGFTLGRLHQLKDNAVKSLLYTKIVAILNHDIHLKLEITESVPVLSMDSITLCRILGILLDNALEASLISAEKSIHITIVTTDSSVLFSIANSTLPLPVSVTTLLKRGYSSKKGHEGVGLTTVIELLDSISCAELSTKYEGSVFCQTLEVLRHSKKTATPVSNQSSLRESIQKQKES